MPLACHSLVLLLKINTRNQVLKWDNSVAEVGQFSDVETYIWKVLNLSIESFKVLNVKFLEMLGIDKQRQVKIKIL
jgi:hypothetical protein